MNYCKFPIAILRHTWLLLVILLLNYIFKKLIFSSHPETMKRSGNHMLNFKALLRLFKWSSFNFFLVKSHPRQIRNNGSEITFYKWFNICIYIAYNWIIIIHSICCIEDIENKNSTAEFIKFYTNMLITWWRWTV